MKKLIAHTTHREPAVLLVDVADHNVEVVCEAAAPREVAVVLSSTPKVGVGAKGAVKAVVGGSRQRTEAYGVVAARIIAHRAGCQLLSARQRREKGMCVS